MKLLRLTRFATNDNEIAIRPESICSIRRVFESGQDLTLITSLNGCEELVNENYYEVVTAIEVGEQL